MKVEITFEKKKEILKKIDILLELYQKGELGGEIMPEDCNPGLKKHTKENYLYFTLPMALNYQRNSYKLWEAAKSTYCDSETKWVFMPEHVVKENPETLRDCLLKHKLALQPNRHTEIWKKICGTIVNDLDNDIRTLFLKNNNSIKRVKEYIMDNKKGFPYLSGTKILNYWLYVITQYTDAEICDKRSITVAPDTHVIQASEKLGVINQNDMNRTDIREYVSCLWENILSNSSICPIDIHTPLWLWSRGGFRVEVDRTNA